MRALCDRLGNPERSFRSLHVVGTNGKSSVTLMTAALLGAAGIRCGACLSPHLFRWSERTRIDGEEVGAEPFAAAVAEVAAAVGEVERELGEGQRVTQFEAAIAASFCAFRRAGIEVAVVEAGLGGRLDATNVIPSIATALTSVGLDHTEWLGETVEEIAAEKVAVLRERTVLVVGPLEEPIATLAREHAAARDAELLDAGADASAQDEGLPAAATPAGYLRANAAVARALASVALGRSLDPAGVAETLRRLPLPGRLELVDAEPPLVLDAAHNEQGAAALAAALPELSGGAEVVGCVSVLADKDADAIAAALAPALARVVATAAQPGPALGRPGAAAADPDLLAARFERAGVAAEAIAEPRAALRRARELAVAVDGVALAAGSHYLLRYAWTERHDQSCCR